MASEFPNDTIGHPPAGGMVGRIKRLMMSPKTEWPAIDAEPMTVRGIMIGWVVPLALIGPVAVLIGGQLFGYSTWFASYKPPLIPSIVAAVMNYGFALLGVWLWSLILDWLAPHFGGTKSPISALKLVAFSATAAWLAQIFGLIPSLLILSVVGLYSCWIFWLGVPVTMKVPDDQRAAFTIAAIVVGAVVMAVAFGVAGLVARPFVSLTSGYSSPATIADGGTVTLPDGSSIDTGQAKAQVESTLADLKAQSGKKAVDPGTLQGLIPATITGWNRTSIESSGGGAMGMNISEAIGKFEAGDQSFRLKVTDAGAMGALAGIVNVESSKQTATSYEKSSLQDGKMVTEKWNSDTKSGTFSVLVAKRFLIEADGDAPNIDALKAAVAAVDQGKLEALAK